MLKYLAKKFLDTIVVRIYQYCYDRLQLRPVQYIAVDKSPSENSQSCLRIPDSFYKFLSDQSTFVIFGNSYEAAYVSEMILLSKHFFIKDNFKGYIISDDMKHYCEYWEYPMWNISDFPFQANDVGVIIACCAKQHRNAIGQLIERGFTLHNLYIFDEPCRAINSDMLINAVKRVKNSHYKVIIHGANREGEYLYHYLRRMGIEVLYYISDILFSETFNSLPLRSIYDLIFENMEDKFIFVVGRYPPNLQYELGWDKQSAFFDVENIKYHSLLSQRGLYVDINTNVQPDANLGSNIYRGEMQGLRIWGNWDAQHAVKIVTLGGSTTDPFYADYSELYISWSEILYTRLRAVIPNIAIACGGIEAYISSQDLLKLIRDIIPLKPDLVIDLGIVNDLHQYFIYKTALDGSDEKKNHHKRPFLSLTTERFYRFAHENSVHYKLTKDMRPVCFGIHDKRNAVEFWVDALRTMYALGHEFSFKFLGILQPTAVTYKTGNVQAVPTWTDEMFDFQSEAYKSAQQAIQKYPFLLDYTDIFNDLDENPYMDGVHVLPHGNRTIAEHVHQDILRLGLLQGRSTA
jgi:hypothetical protein